MGRIREMGFTMKRIFMQLAAVVLAVAVAVPMAAPARAARQHNYELKVMRRIVQKYNGTMTTENQNLLSAVKIVLPPPKS